MSLFKCKMCGGALEIEGNQTIATCEYCGTQQTLPKLDDDRRISMYERANHFRRNNEFDKAMGIYEQILNEDNTDAEAYWSLVLCRYGIEYVEDPDSHRHIPTVNRAQFTSIYDDENYQAAIRCSDALQRGIYEAEANAINEIQKGILAISQKEEPFDIFICYKETGADGRRTPDSVLATELYQELTREGFKVFFSRITLEDKLGIAYEPYIFAALNSAKVMVVLGTKPEHFNAVWVKNEWSRYLTLIKGGARKMLIPAYKNMDPYGLPEEFSHLQAQDMSKLGFMQDLVRGIKKIVEADAPKVQVKETVITSMPSIAPLLERAFMFLEDREWESADEYCEKVLDQDPKCARAYLGKLMAEKKVTRPDRLAELDQPIATNNNYLRAVRFADGELKKMLTSAAEKITARSREKANAEAYTRAKELMDRGTSATYDKAAEIFDGIKDYRDAEEMAELCRRKSVEYINDKIYNGAVSKMEDLLSKSELEAIIRELQRIPTWRDSEAKIAKCREMISDLERREREEKLARERADEAARQAKRQAEENARLERERAAEAKKRADKKRIKIELIVIASVAVFVLLCIFVIVPTINVIDGNYYDVINRYELTRFEIPEGTTVIKRGAFRDCKSLEYVSIPDSVVEIGDGAFEGCSSLTRIELPGSLKSIRDRAFQGCTNLVYMYIPASVERIGSQIFDGCSHLETLTFGGEVSGGIDYNALEGCNALREIYFEGGIPVTRYSHKNSLSDIYINDGATAIPAYAFADCQNLSYVEIPDTVTHIHDSAFYGCTNLTTLQLGSSVRIIGNSAFSECTGLTQVYLPDSVEKLGEFAFSHCENLKYLTLGSSLKSIDYGAFEDCTSLSELTLPEGLTTIGDAAFYGCTNLESVVIPDSVDDLGDRVFGDCKSLYEVVIGDSVPVVKSEIFTGCEALSKVTIGDASRTLHADLFLNCPHLSEVVIGDSVTEIPEGMFRGRTELTSVTIGSGVETIGAEAFMNCTSLSEIIIPDSVITIDRAAFMNCTSLTKVVIGNSVTTIGDSAFDSCSSLSDLTIGSVETIGYRAFSHCEQLESVVIPDNAITIGEHAFSYCTALREVTVGDSVTTICPNAFEGCSSLTDITLGESVEFIGGQAFYYCSSLTKIIIPASVRVIEYEALAWCGDLIIYCRAPEQPAGWEYYWQGYYSTIVWGYTGD